MTVRQGAVRGMPFKKQDFRLSHAECIRGPVVEQCPKKGTPLGVSFKVWAESVGATRSLMGAARQRGDAMCFARALSVGAMAVDVKGVA